ncbi:hypothetical protein [Streptomyces sp. NPDC058279]|uniref:hypothetical protein n=1 Tax=Streptomyces sp. NPDC058279 TaxID=3346418 RepID=UPI0036EEE448
MSDLWQGQPLADASPVTGEADTIHYRIHAVDDGELLAFGTASGGALHAVMVHVHDVQLDHPHRRIVVRQYDGPAST